MLYKTLLTFLHYTWHQLSGINLPQNNVSTFRLIYIVFLHYLVKFVISTVETNAWLLNKMNKLIEWAVFYDLQDLQLCSVTLFHIQ